jgi:hypothetical protein
MHAEDEHCRLDSRLEAGAREYACGDFLSHVEAMSRSRLYETLLLERLARKHRVVQQFYKESASDWNQTLYQLLFRTVGDVKNRTAFVQLARKVPYHLVLKERSSLHMVEALLFGASGLLETSAEDDYVRVIRRDFDYLSHKYRLKPMSASEWCVTSVRPANHPVLRVAQLAAFLASNDFLIDKLLACRSAVEVHRLFAAEASDYWYSHYLPGVVSVRMPKRIGRTKSCLLGINLVAVMQYAYGAYRGDERQQAQALALLHSITAEENRYMKQWCNRGLAPADAFESQALLQLSTEYCEVQRCRQCPVGRLRHDALDNA